jgi:hypothetical protein
VRQSSRQPLDSQGYRRINEANSPYEYLIPWPTAPLKPRETIKFAVSDHPKPSPEAQSFARRVDEEIVNISPSEFYAIAQLFDEMQLVKK